MSDCFADETDLAISVEHTVDHDRVDCSRVRALKIFLCALAIGMLLPEIGLAHSPHDSITAIQLSSRFHLDALIFTIVRGNLLYSLNAGLTWLRLMRGLGGVVLTDLVLSPDYSADKVGYVASDGGGVFRLDRSMVWRPRNGNLANPHIVSLAISPLFGENGRLVALGDQGDIHLTDDGGACWRAVAMLEVRITCMAFSSFGALLGSSTGEVYLLKDDAMHPCLRLPATERITSIAAVDAAKGDVTAYVGTESGEIWGYELTSGRLLQHVDLPSASAVTSIALRTEREGAIDVLAATWDKALFRTDNRGTPLRIYDGGLSTHKQADEFGQPHFKGICVSSAFHEDRTVFLGGFDGLFKSTDGGHTWTEVREVLSIGIVVGLDLSPALAEGGSLAYTTYGSGVYLTRSRDRINWETSHFGSSETRLFDIAYSPDYQNDRTLFSACNAGLLISRDGGENWEKTAFSFDDQRGGSFKTWLFSSARRAQRLLSLMVSREKLNALKDVFLRSTGHLRPRTDLFGFGSQLAISPGFALDKTLFVVAFGGIVRSTDAGRSLALVWDSRSNEMLRFVALSPEYTSDHRVFALGSEHVFSSSDRGDTWQAVGDDHEWQFECLAISPDFKRDRTLFAGSRNGGFVRSSDGGESWQRPCRTESHWLSARNIFVSPDFRHDHEVFLQTYDSGLLRSRDAGHSFTQISVDPEAPDISFCHLNEFPDRSLLLKFCPDYKHNRSIYAACMNSLYRSDDAGDTWARIAPAPVRYEAARYEIRTLPSRAWHVVHDRRFSASTAYYSVEKGAKATLGFVGIGVRWIASRGPNHGIAEVLIDGEYVQSVDLNGAHFEGGCSVFEITGLPFRDHAITVVVNQASNARASGKRVVINAFDVVRERVLP